MDQLLATPYHTFLKTASFACCCRVVGHSNEKVDMPRLTIDCEFKADTDRKIYHLVLTFLRKTTTYLQLSNKPPPLLTICHCKNSPKKKPPLTIFKTTMDHQDPTLLFSNPLHSLQPLFLPWTQMSKTYHTLEAIIFATIIYLVFTRAYYPFRQKGAKKMGFC